MEPSWTHPEQFGPSWSHPGAILSYSGAMLWPFWAIQTFGTAVTHPRVHVERPLHIPEATEKLEKRQSRRVLGHLGTTFGHLGGQASAVLGSFRMPQEPYKGPYGPEKALKGLIRQVANEGVPPRGVAFQAHEPSWPACEKHLQDHKRYVM